MAKSEYCMLAHVLDPDTQAYTYCKLTDCEGYEEQEDIQEELNFDEED